MESIQIHSSVLYTLRPRNIKNFLRRPTQVDNTADNADITESQAANHHRLTELRDTRPRRMQEVNSLCTDIRALRAEYYIVDIPHTTAI